MLKDYNFSDLYVLFVGHLSDRIADPRPFETPWRKVTQLQERELAEMQRQLTARGLYQDKLDGKAGMLTRAALGAYQKANGLKLDCWPTAAVLEHMRRARAAKTDPLLHSAARHASLDGRNGRRTWTRKPASAAARSPGRTR